MSERTPKGKLLAEARDRLRSHLASPHWRSPVLVIADAYELATDMIESNSREDDELYVSASWLNWLVPLNAPDLSMMSVTFQDGKFHLTFNRKTESGVEDPWVAPKPATRGDVRQLLRIMGIQVREENNG